MGNRHFGHQGQFCRQCLAPRGVQRFAVGQALRDAGWVQHHGGGGDGACQGATTYLVNPRHADQATGEACGFKAEVRQDHGAIKAQFYPQRKPR